MFHLRRFNVTFFLAVVMASSARADEARWQPVATALGKSGTEMAGGVYRVGLPRTDLHVTLDGVVLEPVFALGSWVAFKPIGAEDMVMGDLVLLENEVAPVMRRLVRGGIEVTALHNHLLRARPLPVYMHITGLGDPVALARTLRTALLASKTPLASAPTARPHAGGALDTAALDRIVGLKGSATGDVYQYGIARADTIKMAGVALPAAMGVGIGINFQPTSAGRTAITGDFVLTADQVQPVLKTLLASGIEVTALHNHMLGEEPRLFFMHFWADGNPLRLAKALRAVLDIVRTVKP